MIRYLFFFIVCVSISYVEAYEWPKSQTRTYEVLGGSEVGVLIPVADYEFKARLRSTDPKIRINQYAHVQDPQTQFALFFDLLDDVYDVEIFGKWCLYNGNFIDMYNLNIMRIEELVAGEKGDIPAIRLVSEHGDSIVEQLFLVVGNYGCCFLVTYPIKEKDGQSRYWDSFFNHTLPAIERIARR